MQKFFSCIASLGMQMCTKTLYNGFSVKTEKISYASLEQLN
jgi:hypothetical protein